MARKKKATVASLTSQIAQLNARLQQSARASRGRRQPRRGRRGSSIPAGYSAPQAPAAPRIATSMGGGMRVKHQEFWFGISDGSKTLTVKNFVPGATGLILLDRLARGFDRYRIHSITAHYRPSVGTTKDGAVFMAVDWDATGGTPTDAKVKVMHPQVRVPVWQLADLRTPGERLMEKKWMMCAAAATPGADAGQPAFALAMTHPKDSDLGEVLLSYDVEFVGASGN